MIQFNYFMTLCLIKKPEKKNQVIIIFLKLIEMKSTKRTVKVESDREKKERIAKEGKKDWEKLT